MDKLGCGREFQQCCQYPFKYRREECFRVSKELVAILLFFGLGAM